ncbi:hypothetical protein Moror_6101 [Moniliophthora roreri MCA 2997]|uniref:Uncharacterized protein n=2 Tax=Moniliophthora roreri TaxID=221103 RepID=V2XYS8_MONRO|nr:hypothetical protein Moror_6101 [Moniliophthora roreri MCA 2997]
MTLQPVDLYSADVSTDGNWPKRDGGSRFATCSPSANLKIEFTFKGTYAEAQGKLNIKPGKRPGPNSNIFSVDGFIKQFSVQPTPYTNGTFKLSSSNPLPSGQHTLSISCTADLNEIELDSINYIPADTGSSAGLSKGAIAGVVVGVVCFVVLLVGSVGFWLRKRRKNKAPVEEEGHTTVPFQPPLDIIEGSGAPPPMASQKGSVTQVQPTFEPSPPPYPGPSE